MNQDPHHKLPPISMYDRWQDSPSEVGTPRPAESVPTETSTHSWCVRLGELSARTAEVQAVTVTDEHQQMGGIPAGIRGLVEQGDAVIIDRSDNTRVAIISLSPLE